MSRMRAAGCGMRDAGRSSPAHARLLIPTAASRVVEMRITGSVRGSVPKPRPPGWRGVNERDHGHTCFRSFLRARVVSDQELTATWKHRGRSCQEHNSLLVHVGGWGWGWRGATGGPGGISADMGPFKRHTGASCECQSTEVSPFPDNRFNVFEF